MSTLMIAKGLTKRYAGGTAALENVSLQLTGGRYLGLVGPNGAGKSTLLNVLGGFLQPTSGHVDRRVARVGWCPQQTVVDWSLSVLENVMMPARLFGLSARAARTAACESLQLLGLEASSNTTAETLSGGQLQRVQIARALCIEPDAVLLDEPTTGLDVEGQEALWRDLNRRRSLGVGGLISSHDLDALERECDAFLFLRRGRVFASFDKSELDDRSMEVLEVLPKGEGATAVLAQIAEEAGQVVKGDGSLWLMGNELPPGLDTPIFRIQRHAMSLRSAYKAMGVVTEK